MGYGHGLGMALVAPLGRGPLAAIRRLGPKRFGILDRGDGPGFRIVWRRRRLSLSTGGAAKAKNNHLESGHDFAPPKVSFLEICFF